MRMPNPVPQRKLELKESLLMRSNLAEALVEFRDEFPHIRVEHMLVVADLEKKGGTSFENRYMEMHRIPREYRLAFPSLFFLVVVRDEYNYLTDPERRKVIHHWFCRIPRNYTENEAWVPYDHENRFFSNMQRFPPANSPINSEIMFGIGGKQRWRK